MSSAVETAKDLMEFAGGPSIVGVSVVLGYATQVLSSNDRAPRKGWLALGAGALVACWMVLFLSLAAGTLGGDHDSCCGDRRRHAPLPREQHLTPARRPGAGTAIALVLGLLLGTMSVLVGRRAGRLVGAAVNIAVAFPGLLLALFFAVILGVGAKGAVLAIGFSGAPAFARLSQTLVAGIAERDFVAAARIAGVSPSSTRA